jgi:pyruvate kinase
MTDTKLRRTKIVATLGPATDDDAVFKGMLDNGLNVVRLNFSHGTHAEQSARFERVRRLAKECKRTVGILVDLQGPKIRIGKFKAGPIELRVGSPLILDCELDESAGDETVIGVTYKSLYEEVEEGSELMLDDGAIQLKVTKLDGKKIHCSTLVGGTLSNNKGLNLRGGGLSAGALTHKDKEDIVLAGSEDADFLAISFVRNAADVELARKLFKEAGGNGSIISKIERAEAIDNLEEIIAASDGVMIARGDLGVEIGDEELPFLQKHIIKTARNNDCLTITATQMMQSMVKSALPTRAEVMDIANAIIDGSDAVMLSAETAVGDHPHIVIETMDRVCRGAERQRLISAKYLDDRDFVDAEEAVAMASMYVANKTDIVAIVALTESGHTPRLMSRISSGIPIFALSRHPRTAQLVTLLRGVYPMTWELDLENHNTLDKQIIRAMSKKIQVEKGDKLLVTMGDLLGIQGQTNTFKIITV